MFSLYDSKSSELNYRHLWTELKRHLIKCSSTLIPHSKMEVDMKLSDVNNIKPNYYDEHIFVYVLGKGAIENYSEDLHRNLVLNLCIDKDKCKHETNVLMLGPNNLVFSKILIEFVRDPSFRKEILDNVKSQFSKDKVIARSYENELTSMVKKMKQIISECMVKSIILHVYEPFEKKKLYICNLVSNYLDMNIRICEQLYNELEASEEIDNIRIPQNIETKKATKFLKKGQKVKSINIKYAGTEDLMGWVEGRKYL